MQTTDRRFLDASNNRMDVRGVVKLPLLIGDHVTYCDASVLGQLGADFLMGADVLCDNGLILHPRSRLLYKASTDGAIEYSTQLHCVDGDE